MKLRRSRLLADQRGITSVEYGVLFVLISVGLLGGWTLLNKRMNDQMAIGASRFEAPPNSQEPPPAKHSNHEKAAAFIDSSQPSQPRAPAFLVHGKAP